MPVESEEAICEGAAMSHSLLEARAGSPDAAGRLLEACRPYLLMIANRELSPEVRPKVGASDLVQETFVEAHRDLPRFLGQSEEQLLAWLRRILINNVANARRFYLATEKRNAAREVSLGEAPSGEDWLALAPAADDSPSSEAVHNEDELRLEEAMSRLPEHFRQVLVMRHRQNKAFAEIGESLGRSEAAVRKLWARGIERLQRELNVRGDD